MTQARGHARCLIAVYHPRAENLVVNYCGRRNLPSTTILMKEPHATARPTARYSNGTKSRRRAVATLDSGDQHWVRALWEVGCLGAAGRGRRQQTAE